MACELRIFLGDDAERMVEKYGLNASSIAVEALQVAIHNAAISFEPWETRQLIGKYKE